MPVTPRIEWRREASLYPLAIEQRFLLRGPWWRFWRPWFWTPWRHVRSYTLLEREMRDAEAARLAASDPLSEIRFVNYQPRSALVDPIDLWRGR